MKEQQHTDDDRGGSTDKSQDEQNLRSGSGVGERQPARNHQYGPIKVSCQSIAITSPRILLGKPCAADRQRARKRSDAAICHPRLSCTQGATGVQSSQKGHRFVRTRDGRVHLPVFSGYAQCTAETRTPGGSAAGESGRRILMPHGTGSPRYGASASAMRIAATRTSQASGSVLRHAARARRCSLALMRGPRGSPCLAHLGPITIPVQDPKWD